MPSRCTRRARAGGHARTLDLPLPGRAPHDRATVPVDTGFIVYNTATYPDLVSLFETLRLDQDNSSMSFAASVDMPNARVEWGSDSLDALFADRRNLTRSALYTMLYDMRRFNAAVHAFVEHAELNPESPEAAVTLGDFLATGAYSQTFVRCYLVPMVSSVWSASFRSALRFPARTLFRFFVNHGLAQTFARPQWRTPLRRSRDYVEKVVEDLYAHGAVLHTSTRVTAVERSSSAVRLHAAASGSDPHTAQPADFEHVVFAAHAPDVLRLLGDAATPDERRILGAFLYSDNVAYVHTDPNLMPAARGTWSAWNFISRRAPTPPRPYSDSENDQPVCVSYWLNKLQNLNRVDPDVPDLFETLNPCVPINPSKILSEDRFAHPQFTEEAVKAQEELQNVIQGENRSWFCGAYVRYGFHEDGLMTGLDVAERLMGYRVLRPWRAKASLAINNNYTHYPVPFSSPRTLGIVFLGALVVTNMVGARIQAGLNILAKRLQASDPSVVLSTGSGLVLRFGHTSGVGPPPGLISVRSPRLLARATDAIRHHHDLVPVAVSAFIAGEIDCPLPSDLTTLLRALIVAQRRGPELGHGLQGQTHLAETLLHAIVGGFEKVQTPPSESRLPELTTAVTSAVYPCWWLADEESQHGCSVSVTADENGRPQNVLRATPKPSSEVVEVIHSGAAACENILELIGDLCAATVAALQENRKLRATVVVSAPNRVQFIESKAKLLHVIEQVTVMPTDVFLDAIKGRPPELYNRVISPGAVNVCEGLFTSLPELMRCIWMLMPESGGLAQLGFTACDDTHPCREKRGRAPSLDAALCGDAGFRLWPTRSVLDAATAVGFRLEGFSEMPSSTAVSHVEEISSRVFRHLASEKLTTLETRQVIGQFSLWEASLEYGVASRVVVTLERRRSPPS